MSTDASKSSPSKSGRRLLREVISANELTLTLAAKQLKVSVPTLFDWLNGKRHPRGVHRDAIEKWSRGAVPAIAWKTKAERDFVDSIKPIAAPAPIAA